MFLFLLDQFPDSAKPLHCPDKGNREEIAGGDTWSLLQISLVTGGTLKCNFTFKTHYWAHKLVCPNTFAIPVETPTQIHS